MKQTSIERVKDELTKEAWDFTLIRETLFLNGYQLLKRESTKKRKYIAVKKYDRLQSRNSNIEESEVPFTNEIKKEALERYFETIDVRRWSER
jgi:Fe-S cluster biosynthesis and repair protein YggX